MREGAGCPEAEQKQSALRGSARCRVNHAGEQMSLWLTSQSILSVIVNTMASTNAYHVPGTVLSAT